MCQNESMGTVCYCINLLPAEVNKRCSFLSRCEHNVSLREICPIFSGPACSSFFAMHSCEFSLCIASPCVIFETWCSLTISVIVTRRWIYNLKLLQFSLCTPLGGHVPWVYLLWWQAVTRTILNSCRRYCHQNGRMGHGLRLWKTKCARALWWSHYRVLQSGAVNFLEE